MPQFIKAGNGHKLHLPSSTWRPLCETPDRQHHTVTTVNAPVGTKATCKNCIRYVTQLSKHI